jgi:hypothetical protein
MTPAAADAEQNVPEMNCHAIPAWWKLEVLVGPAKEQGVACQS